MIDSWEPVPLAPELSEEETLLTERTVVRKCVPSDASACRQALCLSAWPRLTALREIQIG